jgi:hypothetical protein
MRRNSFGTGAAVMFLVLATGCGQAGTDDGPTESAAGTPAPTPGVPEVRIFTLLDRAALPAGQRQAHTVEITGAAALDTVVPARAFPDDELPELPSLGKGERRFAAVTSGCQEQDPPQISGTAGAWHLAFADNGVRCVAPDYYVVVWDVED